jgi:hypothetical protein
MPLLCNNPSIKDLITICQGQSIHGGTKLGAEQVPGTFERC